MQKNNCGNNPQLAWEQYIISSLINYISDAVIIVDKNGIVKELNTVAKSFFEISQNDIRISVEQLFDHKIRLADIISSSSNESLCKELTLDSKGKLLLKSRAIKNEQGDIIGGLIIINSTHGKKNVNKYHATSKMVNFSDIIGESTGMVEAKRIAKLASTSSANVLVFGESGTGKEIMAQAIHSQSNRRSGPFIAVNCGAIPRELIGSELFGYEEGAFTGAKRGGRPGKFESACGGTLFLDEIGDMPLEQQVSLLRVLQEKRVTRIGSNIEIPVDARIICATNKNLLELVDQGKFRRDLYYRFNVIPINIPPLRKRGEDIPLLFNYFLKKVEQERGITFNVDPDVILTLVEYSWPGNVREMQNVVERVTSLIEGYTISVMNLPQEILQTQIIIYNDSLESYHPLQINKSDKRKQILNELERQERQEIVAMFGIYEGNISQIARKMGISRNTLYRKMRLYGINY